MARFITPEGRERLIEAMSACEQTSGMSVLQHGEMVATYYRDILEHVRWKEPLDYEWRLPEWIYDPLLWQDLPPDDLMLEYHLFHDCGKPACKTVDDDGRQHFPDHAAVSRRIWLKAGGDSAVGDLIGMDMDVHLLRGDDMAEFALRPQARALLLTALAEVHANASMFGGISSTSFKIKAKHIDKRGRAVLRAIAAREVPMAA